MRFLLSDSAFRREYEVQLKDIKYRLKGLVDIFLAYDKHESFGAKH